MFIFQFQIKSLYYKKETSQVYVENPAVTYINAD